MKTSELTKTIEKSKAELVVPKGFIKLTLHLMLVDHNVKHHVVVAISEIQEFVDSYNCGDTTINSCCIKMKDGTKWCVVESLEEICKRIKEN